MTDLAVADTAQSALAMLPVDEQQKGALLPAFSHQASPARGITVPAPRGIKRETDDAAMDGAAALRAVRPRVTTQSAEEDLCNTGTTAASTLVPSPRDNMIAGQTFDALDSWAGIQDSGVGLHDYLFDSSAFDSKNGTLGLFFGSPFHAAHVRGYTGGTHRHTP